MPNFRAEDFIIFTGPTLTRKECLNYMKCTVLPPVRHEDLISVYFKYNPKIVLIIDGFFGNVPSVWHREILFMLDKGIHMFGAASMGALRASEMHSFGMIGIGKIFEDFKSGALNDDDEVTVIHADEKQDYKSLSEAMVNIRETLSKAHNDNIISDEFRDAYTGIAKNFFYKERSYKAINQAVSSIERFQNESEFFKTWLEKYSIDQKKQDALESLSHITENYQNLTGEPLLPSFEYNHTNNLRRIIDRIENKNN